MGYALKIYEAFEDLGKDKAAILAEFVEYIESRKAATSEELKTTELRLQKQIEEVRLEVGKVKQELQKEIEGVRLELQKQIEEVRLEVEKVKQELQKRIEEVRLELRKEIEEVRLEMERVKSDLLKWMFVFWAGQIAAIGGLMISILHWFLG